MKHEYKLLESAGSCELGIAATRYLAEGWELWGNPFSTTSMFGDRYFHQAMVRQIESEHISLHMEAISVTAEKTAGYTVQVPETPAEAKIPNRTLVGGEVPFLNSPASTAILCACFEKAGDNPNCLVHKGGTNSGRIS